MEQIILPAVVDSLKALCAFLDRNVALAGLEEKARGRLHLAVDEIATNIITHGYEEHGLTGDIVVQAEITPEALTIALEDTAVPFNPHSVATPASLGQSLEERPIGGLGIFLMLRNVDRYEYAYVEGKNRNIFVINRPVQIGE